MMKKLWNKWLQIGYRFQRWAEDDKRIIFKREGYRDFKGEYEGYVTIGTLVLGCSRGLILAIFTLLLLRLFKLVELNDIMWRYFGFSALFMMGILSIRKKYCIDEPQNIIDNHDATTRRIALIIGNNNYEHYDSLKKQPLNDADAIEERLKTLGTEVVKHTNLNYDGIRRAILDFRQKAKGYDDITFFYAGHGLSYNGKNYLVPTDATPPTTEAELEDLMYAYEQVVKHFADMDGCWNHFFIDACRHTLQFDERGIPTIGDAEKKQLEKWKKRNGKNVCIFFGAAEGESAYNNSKGDNGIFTTALLKHLVQGITLNELIEKVTAETLQISGYKQLPYVTATKVGEYVF